MVKDKIFGRIIWEGDHWAATVSLPYFRGAGGRVYMPDEDRKLLPPVDKLPLRIETGSARKRPSNAQQIAWETIVQREDSIWCEAMDAAITEYQRQRPMRARYWRVVNNPQLLLQSLPADVDRQTMKKLLLPLSGMLHQEETKAAFVNCFVTFLATWWSESLNVYIQDGKVTEVVPMGWFMNRKLPWIDTSVFGRLRRHPRKAEPWFGEAELGPFRFFAAVAVDRATWDQSYGRSDEATSDLPWDVARGSSQLSVYAPPDVPPSAKQSATFEQFLKGADGYANKIVEAVFELYDAIAPMRRTEYNGPNPEAAFPSLSDPSGLREITELRELFVFPDTDAPIALGFKFRGPWTGNDGIGVRWRDGKVEAVGHPDIADPDRFQGDDAKKPLA